LILRYRTQADALIFDKATCLAQKEFVMGGIDEEKLLFIDVGAASTGWLRGRTNDGDDDYDHAGSDNDGASSRGSGDETSATGSR
jgi:hypothetical protein